MKKISLLFVVIAVLALVLVGACGGNDEEETTAATTTVMAPNTVRVILSRIDLSSLSTSIATTMTLNTM